MLRIRRRRSQIRGLDSTRQSTDSTQFDTYLGRLVKLIPSEVIAFYLVGRGILPATEGYLWLVWTMIGVVAVIVVRARATKNPVEGVGRQWTAVAISSISFLIW